MSTPQTMQWLLALLTKYFCCVMHLHAPQCTADMTGLQGPLLKANMDMVSQPCTFLLLQPSFLQLLFLWTIEANVSTVPYKTVYKNCG